MTFNIWRTSRKSAHDNDFSGEDAAAAFRRTDKMLESDPSTATEFGKGRDWKIVKNDTIERKIKSKNSDQGRNRTLRAVRTRVRRRRTIKGNGTTTTGNDVRRMGRARTHNVCEQNNRRRRSDDYRRFRFRRNGTYLLLWSACERGCNGDGDGGGSGNRQPGGRVANSG